MNLLKADKNKSTSDDTNSTKEQNTQALAKLMRSFLGTFTPKRLNREGVGEEAYFRDTVSKSR